MGTACDRSDGPSDVPRGRSPYSGPSEGRGSVSPARCPNPLPFSGHGSLVRPPRSVYPHHPSNPPRSPEASYDGTLVPRLSTTSGSTLSQGQGYSSPQIQRTISLDSNPPLSTMSPLLVSDLRPRRGGDRVSLSSSVTGLVPHPPHTDPRRRIRPSSPQVSRTGGVRGVLAPGPCPGGVDYTGTGMTRNRHHPRPDPTPSLLVPSPRSDWESRRPPSATSGLVGA